ncbi:MATE family efflux transporter [uncultured Ruthenibacterium sp.]|uniref:MATE family efflux transporter n=1 Tax=uncultured Ruthenibacterium sp. TaxID=1905347 RepID=UPI00349E8087
MNRKSSMLRTLFLLAGPTVIEQALQTVVQYADTAMVGQIGAQASAAVGLTITVTWLVTSPLFAMGVGVLALIAKSIGENDLDKARAAAGQAVWIALVLGILLGALTLGISPFLPGWMGADRALHRDASLYFAIICAPMLFRSFSVIFAAVLRAVGDTKTPMVVNGAMNLCNILLNQLLISNGQTFSILGLSVHIPGAGWGIVGAAVATAVSLCLGGMAMFLAMARHPLVRLRPKELRVDKPVLEQIVRIGLPVTLNRVVNCLGQVVFTSLVAGLGTLATAAHSIALTAEEAFYVPGYGMQAATSTLSGNALGRRDPRELAGVARASLTLAVGVMSLMALGLFLFPDRIMSLFTPDAEVVRTGAGLLRMVAVSEPLFAGYIICEGIFQGIGDTKGPFVCSMVCMWLVRVCMTFVCVRWLGLGLQAVWACMIADNVLRCVWLSARYLAGAWKARFSRL